MNAHDSSFASAVARFRFPMILATLSLLLVLLGSVSVQAQEMDSTARSTRPAANPADVESPEAIVEAAYDVISEPAGETVDVDRLRSLFVPDARLIPTGRQEGTPRLRAMTVEEFIEGANLEETREEGFIEREIASETDRFGDIAHVLSTYESRRSMEDEPFQRGINSFQLWNDGDRWWIVTIFWHSEREGAPIPERYLNEDAK